MTRPIQLPPDWRDLALAVEAEWIQSHPGHDSPGAVLLVAQALHSDVGTVRRWAHGRRQPRGPAKALIEALFQKHRPTSEDAP